MVDNKVVELKYMDYQGTRGLIYFNTDTCCSVTFALSLSLKQHGVVDNKVVSNMHLSLIKVLESLVIGMLLFAYSFS